MIIGNQQTRQFTINQWGSKKWGLYKLPDATEKKYPVIIFMHGRGEAGTTESDLSKLLTHGVPYILSQGTALTFTNPLTGLQNSFISIALQDPYWSPDITEMMFIIDNDPVLKSRIDQNGIFVTGLSAGGQMCINSILTIAEITNRIRAVVPMSAAGGVNDANYPLGVGKPIWAFHGKQDTVCPYQITESFVSHLGGKWTQLPLGHGGWNGVFTTSFKDWVNGFYVTIYEWLLMQMPVPVLSISKIDIVRTATTLEFTVDDEQDVERFIIDESTDGKNFFPLDVIRPNGSKRYIKKI